jgi:hypothetical protein
VSRTREARLRIVSPSKSTLPSQATSRALEADLVGRLAKFFPQATPVRIPIKLSRARANSARADSATAEATNAEIKGNGQAAAADNSDTVFFQNTIIEFGTPHEVLFTVERPLEFADRVLVESNDGSLHAEASVVAVQYHPERTAVAARFLKNVPNWIVKS